MKRKIDTKTQNIENIKMERIKHAFMYVSILFDFTGVQFNINTM